MGKALMPYHGGKARQAHWIAEELNKCPHRCFIEPFAGAASIFFHKQRAEINVLNDTNFNIVSIFKALRDCPEFMPLIQELSDLVPVRRADGTFTYEAPPGLHDDCVMALALALEAARSFHLRHTANQADVSRDLAAVLP